MTESNVKKVEYFKSPHNDQWYFHELAGNGEIVGTSEAYKTKWNVLRAAEAKWPGIEPSELK